MTSYASSDPTVALTSSQASFADSTSPTFAAFATHQRVRALETAAASVAADAASLDAAVAALSEGVAAYNTIAISANPTAGNTLTIGADVYEFVAAAGSVANNANIGVVRGANVAATMANLIAGIHATYGTGDLTGLFKVGGLLPALKNGTEDVFAFYAGGVLNVLAADAPGGDVVTGTVPSIACSDTLTEVVSWAFANLNLSTGGVVHTTQVARAAFIVSAAQALAASVVLRLPVYSANMFVKVSGMSATGAPLVLTDTAVVAAVTGSTSECRVTLTLIDLVETDRCFIEVWA